MRLSRKHKANADNFIRHFGYSLRTRAWTFISFLAAVLWPVVVELFSTRITSPHGDPGYYIDYFLDYPLAGLLWVSFLVLVVMRIFTHRPVAIADDGVISFFLGFQWRKIYWNKMLIERITTLDSFNRNRKETITLKNGRRRIHVQSNIEDYGEFQRLINYQLSARNIDVVPFNFVNED